MDTLRTKTVALFVHSFFTRAEFHPFTRVWGETKSKKQRLPCTYYRRSPALSKPTLTSGEDLPKGSIGSRGAKYTERMCFAYASKILTSEGRPTTVSVELLRAKFFVFSPVRRNHMMSIT